MIVSAVALAFFLSFTSAGNSLEIYEYHRIKRGTVGKEKETCTPKQGQVNFGFNMTTTPVSSFRLSSLFLNIPHSPCIKTWTLSIITCEVQREVHDGFMTWRDLGKHKCRSLDSMDFETTRIKSYEYDFKADVCYWFHLNPKSCDPTCSVNKNNIFFTSAHGCLPEPDPPKPSKYEKEVTVWYLVGVGIVMALAGIVCGIFTTKFICKTKLSQDENYSSTVIELETIASILVLYRREDEEHQRRVSGAMKSLEDQLGCQIFDLYEGNAEMNSDPHGWILKAMTLGSNVKVVLVNSPEVIRLQRSFLHHGQVTRSDNRSVDIDEQTNAFLLALKRLHERDLVYDYKRVFVVSWDNSIKNDLKLLVEAKRYHLPDHWPSLLADLSSSSA